MRLAAFTQSSTRYCNYSKNKFGSEIQVICPLNLHKAAYDLWERSMYAAESAYMQLISEGVPPQIARSVLPNSLATELIMTANLREWRHIFSLRTSPAAHPQMREVMDDLLLQFKKQIPLLFNNLNQ